MKMYTFTLLFLLKQVPLVTFDPVCVVWGLLSMLLTVNTLKYVKTNYVDSISFLEVYTCQKKKYYIISNICVLSFLLPLSELKEESLGNTLGMSDPEISTVLHEINSVFPVLLFNNKHSNTRSALEKHTVTSKRILQFLA